MVSRKSRIYMRILAAALAVFTATLTVAAQEDLNPNSPTPVLLSHAGTTRALAIPADSLGRVNISRAKGQAFASNAKIVLFLTNLDLMKGEGANAFRVYAEDSLGRKYRFPLAQLRSRPQRVTRHLCPDDRTDRRTRLLGRSRSKWRPRRLYHVARTLE